MNVLQRHVHRFDEVLKPPSPSFGAVSEQLRDFFCQLDNAIEQANLLGALAFAITGWQQAAKPAVAGPVHCVVGRQSLPEAQAE